VKANDNTLWGIRAGSQGQADSLFLNQSYVAMGWKEVKSLNDLEANRDAFYKKVADTYEGIKKGAMIFPR